MNNEKLSNQEVLLAAKGAYLMHGGTPDGWNQMRPDDVQLIYLMYSEERARLPMMFSKKE